MRVGVIGCGSIGSKYVGWFRDLGVCVVACDSELDRLDVAGHNGATVLVSSIDAMLESGVEKVLIATPPASHSTLAVRALGAGLDVLIEKPLAPDSLDAQAISMAAAGSNGKAWVVCNMRFHPGIQCIQDNLSRIGKPLFARAHFGHLLSQMRPANLGKYAADSSVGGGVILDCIHEFDYLRWLFGPIVEAHTFAARIGPEQIEAEDYANIRLFHAGGCHAELHLDFLMRWKRRGLEVHGTEGSLIWSSEGKSPEQCAVRFTEFGREDLLLNDSAVDPSSPYLAMLKCFISGSDKLQTLGEACDVLEVALNRDYRRTLV